MEFNPDPLKQATQIIFSCKRNETQHPPIYFNGVEVATENEQIHLGLTLTKGLNFSKHVHEKIKKANKNIGIIKHLSKYLPFKTLNQMYKTFSRTHMDYCDIIYHQAAKITAAGQVLTTLVSNIERHSQLQEHGKEQTVTKATRNSVGNLYLTAVKFNDSSKCTK